MSAQQGYVGQFYDPYDYQEPYFDPYKNGYTNDDSSWGTDWISSGNSFGEKVSDWLGITDYKGRYERWLAQQDRAYERASTNSARAWDLFMDSTKIQRLKRDIEAAGLNPWLALQGGNLNAGQNTQTAGMGSSARMSSSHSDKKSNATGIAALLVAAAKLFTLLA